MDDVETAETDERWPEGHPHRYDPSTDVCVEVDCDKTRPEWLTPEEAARAHLGSGPPKSSVGRDAEPRKFGWMAVLGMTLAAVLLTHVGAHLWGSKIAEESDNGDIPVRVEMGTSSR